MIFALAMKFKLFGVQMGELKPVEFITIVLAGLAVLAGGSYLRFYQYVSYQKLVRNFSNKRLRIAEKTMNNAERPAARTSGGEGALEQRGISHPTYGSG